MRQIAVILVFWLWGNVLAHAQESGTKVPVIGWLTPATTQSYSQTGRGNPGPHLLRESLARHGLIDGRNVRVDMRLAEGNLDRLAGLAEALVRDGATVILAYGESAAQAAAAATKTLAIVCVCDDLVGSGLAANLAIPSFTPTT